MKTSKTVVALAVALAGFTAAESAFAQHRHRHHHGSRISLGIGFALPFAAYSYYGPRYSYYPPYSYYYPAPVVVQQPPVYVEQSPQPAQPAPADYWYFCAESRAYYPHVRECASGWQRVSPQPG